MGVNQFTDLTLDEFYQKTSGASFPKQREGRRNDIKLDYGRVGNTSRR